MIEKKYAKRAVSCRVILCCILLASVLVGAYSYGSHFGSNSAYKQGAKFQQVLSMLADSYVEEVDLALFTAKAIEAGLKTLDPHTKYQPSKQATWIQQKLRGTFEGIGIKVLRSEGSTYVRHMAHNGPAVIGGLRVGDRLIRLNGEPISTKTDLDRLRGPANSHVSLEVERNNKALVLDITRDWIMIPAVAATHMLTQEVGYIYLRRFNAFADKDLHKSLRNLTKLGMKQLILDLRGNGGGYMQVAIKVAEAFLSQGTYIVRTKGRKRAAQVYKDLQASPYEALPLIILMDESTASASEILISALQDNKRALIVGRPSYGKGLIQETHALLDGSALLLSIARYYTPQGRYVQKPYGEAGEASSVIRARNLMTQGGILPDVKTSDKIPPLPWLKTLDLNEDLQKYARNYYVTHVDALDTIKNPQEMYEIVAQFPFQTDKLQCLHTKHPEHAPDLIKRDLIAELAYMRWGLWASQKVCFPTDKVLQQALTQWKRARALCGRKR